MAIKRKRHADPAPKILAPGEYLKRSALVGGVTDYSWGWVGTDVRDPARITSEHRMRSCGLSRGSKHSYCSNKYAPEKNVRDSGTRNQEAAGGELDDDVIVISDDEPSPCSKKLCKGNPNCLNYLGQDKWEEEDKAKDAFLKSSSLGENPVLEARDPDVPVGLKNLGATCYANAFLQVWFRDLAFRDAVYQCQAPSNSQHSSKFEESPVFQLQVTFAALQESTEGVFNPTRLVESLKLSTTEQQDAQEFSKLFMSHLDAEFKKQAIPALRSLISDQVRENFEGKQVYGTMCDSCSHRSERPSDFLEIEINFGNNARLEDCIAAMLQPEKLEGDNKYLCSACDSLQNATRTTTLLKLPPVLHFSLLRFVYDLKSMERKKSKNGIIFPRLLNMQKFVKTDGAEGVKEDAKKEYIYELKGVLLHKGASAYHGHYEAQVWDATTDRNLWTSNSAWFQFDDETVTKIKTLGDKLKPDTVDWDASTGQKNHKPKPKPKPKKATKRRVESDDNGASDDDTKIIKPPPPVLKPNGKARADDIYSKDAYMLVYALKDQPADPNSRCRTHGSNSAISEPPRRVMEVIDQYNAAHDKACDAYTVKMRQDCAILDQQSLERWLTAPFGSAKRSNSPFGTDGSIACVHGQLDPMKGDRMKRVARVTKSLLKAGLISTERLYGIEHPQVVARFEEVDEIADDERGFWISKAWLKDWKSPRPKMHSTSNGDMPPDSPDFEGQVICEHGALNLNITSRRRISLKAYKILRDLFPAWQTLSTDAEECPVCTALLHVSKGDKRENRKKAEDEKVGAEFTLMSLADTMPQARLKHMYENAQMGSNYDSENVPCAIIPTKFVRAWKKWVLKPGETTRPEVLDNSPFFCEHSKLVLDPNCSEDLNVSVTIVRRSDWDSLEELYSAGPLIGLEKKRVEDEMFETRYVHDIPICADCRQQRRLEYDTTEITVRILTRQDPNPTPSTYTHYDAFDRQGKQKAPITYGRSAVGTRQSTRIRHVRDKGGKRKLTISKQSTVKDIKVQLQEQLDIPAVYQRLFHNGHELEDNARDAASLCILANDTLHLREELEDDTNATDHDTGPVKKQRIEEGKAFGGTLLGGSSPPLSRSPTEAVEMDIDPNLSQPITIGPTCSACTFVNTPEATTCDVCETVIVA
ncbi:hypothetical protein HWV62_27809 [Athelia sp. TMB]|nr:hypothetical protein HWV62_27809 [Athelia sp. TMB]